MVFTFYVTTKPNPQNDAETTPDDHWKNRIIIFGPPKVLVTAEGPENFNIVIAIRWFFLELNIVRDILTVHEQMDLLKTRIIILAD